MKKQKWKIIKRRLRAKRKHEMKRAKRRKRLNLIKEKGRILEKRKRLKEEKIKKQEFVQHDAPKQFSLLRQTEKVIGYFGSARKIFSTNNNLIFNLKEVEEMDIATLNYMCALVHDAKITNGNHFIGNVPKNPELEKMFERSGFYNFIHKINGSKALNDGEYGELMHVVTNRRADTKIAAKICDYISSFLPSNEKLRVSKNLYTIIGECISNTQDHASPDKKKAKYNWWLQTYRDDKARIIQVCLLDLGIGIFDSLATKKINQQGPFKRRSSSNDILILNEIFNGNTKTTSPEPDRGLGLKEIYDRVTHEKRISHFTLITNSVYAKIGYNMQNQMKAINSSFNGTLYYWEIAID